MKKYVRVISPLLAIYAIAILLSCNTSNKKTEQNSGESDTSVSTSGKTLELKTTVPLPEVKGGFDLMAIDLKGSRLFVSAQDNHSLEVINLKTGTHLLSIPNLNEPKWVFYFPERNRIYVATGGDGKVTEFDGSTYKPVNEFLFKGACNNLRFDPASKQLFVGVGKSFGALGIIDLVQDKIIGEIPLSGYLKQFELDGNLIYVNILEKNQIDVVDRKANKVIATWPVKEAKENVPMALDREHHRLFVGCEPGEFIVFSTSTGKSIASFTISKDADGIYYDAKRSLIYVSCGEGNIEVIKQDDPDSYRLHETIPSVKGAGTSLYSAALDRFILAVPQSDSQKAEIRIYQPVN